PPQQVPALSGDLAARRRAPPPPPPPRAPAPRATPAAPVSPLGARGKTQPLASSLGAATRLPAPSGPGLGAVALAADALSEDIDPSSMMETPAPTPAMLRAPHKSNGRTHGSGVHAAVPSAALSPAESDALNALDLASLAGAAPAPADAHL